ncbi:MAG: hypothetical protein IID44_13060 [Planctomycetes bacterium]|nr:hypothetical protein [Planctomycetota bacterium]
MIEDRPITLTGVSAFQLDESLHALSFCREQVTRGGVPEKEGDSALWVFLQHLVGHVLRVWHCRAMDHETYDALSEEEYEGLDVRFPNWDESFFIGSTMFEDELWDQGNFDHEQLYLDGVMTCLDRAETELSAIDDQLTRRLDLFCIGEQELAQHLKRAIEWIFLAYNARHAPELPDRSNDPELFDKLSHMLPLWACDWRLEST